MSCNFVMDVVCCNICPVVNVMVVVIVFGMLCNYLFSKRSLLFSSCSSSALCICKPPLCVVSFGTHHVFQTCLSLSLPLSLVILFYSSLFDVKSFKVIMSEPPLQLMASEALWTSHPRSEMDQNGGTQLWRFLQAMSGLILGFTWFGC